MLDTSLSLQIMIICQTRLSSRACNLMSSHMDHYMSPQSGNKTYPQVPMHRVSQRSDTLSSFSALRLEFFLLQAARTEFQAPSPTSARSWMALTHLSRSAVVQGRLHGMAPTVKSTPRHQLRYRFKTWPSCTAKHR